MSIAGAPLTEHSIEEALPVMQALASAIWTTQARHHPGQLAWSAAYALPEELGHGPVALVGDPDDPEGWAWAESADWLEICVPPSRPDLVAPLVQWFLGRSTGPVSTMVLSTEIHLVEGLVEAGFRFADRPWFTHHTLDLAVLPLLRVPDGYAVRPVQPGEAEARAAVHRAAWSATSKVSTASYERLMATPPYRPDLDWVVVAPDGSWVGSCCVWLDEATGVALVEPVGVVEAYRRQGLATLVSVAALAAARSAGATTGLVCPRGDDGYPEPQRVYRGIGFLPGPSTVTLTLDR